MIIERSETNWLAACTQVESRSGRSILCGTEHATSGKSPEKRGEGLFRADFLLFCAASGCTPDTHIWTGEWWMVCSWPWDAPHQDRQPASVLKLFPGCANGAI